MSAITESDQLREEGNVLYKAGKLEHAIAKYKLAAKRAPNSSAPLRNLSAAYFETGHYRKCIATAEQALKLGESGGG
ncbi:hypothetical protein ONS95_014128 [Cadophora gregata]|uniref:uncharacterized protein n=1 Tax=Cadophora gregata TaxID=51156 RepID=UPI0026DCDC04|nr:uncharacterized protein ONS95_014128 [Cadophora gregata]KAK0113883.1 hypothetical protein ONS96_014734 [Cadophora gregata f. sp. sojae]KAK0114641.1 hypothetical protein ONS95_014128 [Cadophora gregata]